MGTRKGCPYTHDGRTIGASRSRLVILDDTNRTPEKNNAVAKKRHGKTSEDYGLTLCLSLCYPGIVSI
jgi:hypothetical protein